MTLCNAASKENGHGRAVPGQLRALNGSTGGERRQAAAPPPRSLPCARIGAIAALHAPLHIPRAHR